MAKLVHNIQKKNHRERSQIGSRARFGLLEKKKDYRLRAADHHKKQAALKVLRAKAEAYNPDEYYHAITKRRTDEKGALIADRGNEALSVQQVKLLKTQDANYVRTMRLGEILKIRKEKATLDFDARGKHTVFVDTVEEQQEFTPEVYFNTDKSMVERRENRLRLEQLESNRKLVADEQFDAQYKDRQDIKKLKAYQKLQRRLEREEQLRQVESKMEVTKELMKKGNKKKVVDQDGKVQFKWKNQRKR